MPDGPDPVYRWPLVPHSIEDEQDGILVLLLCLEGHGSCHRRLGGVTCAEVGGAGASDGGTVAMLASLA